VIVMAGTGVLEAQSVPASRRCGERSPPCGSGLYLNAANFSGYAEKYAALRGLRLVNASCPGETTASMLKAGAQSNGWAVVSGN
jgi:hypothetical protein